jgi:hypothetical protein
MPIMANVCLEHFGATLSNLGIVQFVAFIFFEVSELQISFRLRNSENDFTAQSRFENTYHMMFAVPPRIISKAEVRLAIPTSELYQCPSFVSSCPSAKSMRRSEGE